MTTARGVVKQTTYWPLLLFSKYMRGKALATHVRSDAYHGRTFPEWLASTVDLPLLDVSAALSDDGWMNLAVVNVSDTESMSTKIPVTNGPVNVFLVGGAEYNIRTSNKEGMETICIKESIWNSQGNFTFEKHSLTLLRWKTSS
jgi:alpha-N-arabinofuranosidase